MKLKETTECVIKNEKVIGVGDKVYVPEIRDQVENPVLVQRILYSEEDNETFVIYRDEKDGKIDIIKSSKLEKSDFEEESKIDEYHVLASLKFFQKIKRHLRSEELAGLNFNEEELSLIFVDYMRQDSRKERLFSNDFVSFLKERYK